MEFETYKAFSPFGKPHPSTLCLTSTLADARATPPNEDECRRLVHSRLQASASLSDAQFDAVVLAAASHESGHGFLLCDGTGVGKGRELVAIATNWCLRHETRAVVYLSLANVATDAARDVRDCGDFTKDLVFYDCRDLTTEWPKTGLVFVPYTSLNETSLKRIQQLLHHGGSLVLDESHTITNISGKSASMRALLCQKLLKFAKDASAPISVTFASATFATRLLDVEIYAEPLGLVGPRAPFPTFSCLASKLGSCPVEHGYLNLLCAELAFLGRSINRQLSLHGIEFETFPVTPSAQHIAMHDALAKVWQQLMVLPVANTKAASKNVFGAGLRLFKCLALTGKVDQVVELVKHHLGLGHQVVISLISTGEAASTRIATDSTDALDRKR